MRSPVDELPCKNNFQCSVECALPGISVISQGIIKVDTSTCQFWSPLSNSVLEYWPTSPSYFRQLHVFQIDTDKRLDSIVADSHIQIRVAQYGRWIIFP